jgi:tRNA(Ile)-lysidine synthase
LASAFVQLHLPFVPGKLLALIRGIGLVARLEKLVARALLRAGYSGNETTLVVGVSGGPDSSALLYCLHRLSASHRLRLHVAHLNHDFRGEEAEADARFVASLAEELGLPATVEKRDPVAYQRERRISSFEQAARELRYGFLAEVAKKANAPAVAVGHTADDLAETVLMHILRGSGLHGLRGMTEISAWPWPENIKGVSLFRPLLEATKVEAAQYCRELGQSFREDSGNYLPQFTRNRVRHNLMPLLAAEYNPRIREALVRLAHTAALELDYLEQETDRTWHQVVSSVPNGLRFNRQALSVLHPLLQRLLLRRGYVHLKGDARRLGETHLQAMSEMAQGDAAGRTLALPDGLKLHTTYHYLELSRESQLLGPYPPLEGEYPLNLPTSETQIAVTEVQGWRVTAQVFPSSQNQPLSGDAFTAYLDLDSLGKEIYVRSRRPGDRFQPLGMQHQKKLQDFFTDARVPRGWRDRVPLLVSERGIAWVVGYRIAEWAKVRLGEGNSSPILRVKFDQVEEGK